MDASEFEVLLYTLLSEEPFANHRLDMTDGNEEYTISDYVSQNFDITIGETWTCITYHTTKSPKLFKDSAFILPLEEISKEGKNMRKISHEKKTHLGKTCVTMTDLMDKFYETTELSDVICDICTKSRLTTRKSNFEKKTVLKSPMQLRISLQRSHYNVKNNIFCKNKTKIALPDQYSMSFPNDPKVLYILVSINLHIGNDMYQGHYVCVVLDYKTGTW